MKPNGSPWRITLMGPLDTASNPDARFTRDLAAARGGTAATVWDLLALCRGYLLEVAAARLAPGLRAKANPSDLVHDTLLEAHRDFAQFRGRTEAEWLGWLRRLLVHNLANFERAYFGTAKRQARREVALADAGAVPAPGPGPGSAVLIGEREQSVERSLADLPDEYRLVILWHCRDDLSFDEIGARLGRSADAARRLWSRAVDRLQDVVSRHERTG
jgi:RNA polymerase sigma-70 factor (ECF subfamily)